MPPRYRKETADAVGPPEPMIPGNRSLEKVFARPRSFALIDPLPYGRQEEWQDSPEGRPGP